LHNVVVIPNSEQDCLKVQASNEKCRVVI
jgi:hypothetical protein